VTNFGWIDWAIVALYVVGAGVIGFLCRKYIHDMADFVVAGRKLDTGMAIATLASTETGLVTVMYFAEAGYTIGMAACVLGVIFMVVMVVIGLTGFIVKPLRETRIMTIAELYERRYGRGVRVLGGAIIFLAGTLNMGPFLRVGAQFLGTITGLGTDAQSLLIIMSALLLVVLIYTVLGGMFSVSVTDFFQFLLMAIGMGMALVFIFGEVSVEQMANASVALRGESSLSPFEAPKLGWKYILWMTVLWIAACTLWQTGTMRIMAIKSPRLARRVFTLSGLTFGARAIIPMIFGLAALAYFQGHSFEGENILAMPTMLAKVVPTFWLGLLTAGMLAAFMSTHDSYLLGWSAVLVQDVISPLVPGGLSAKTRVWLSRVVIVIIGAFLLVFGLWHEMKGEVWTYLALTGTVYLSGALAVVVGALYIPWANRVGAYCALILGMAPPFVSLGHRFIKGQLLDDALVCLVAFGLAALGMVVGSLATQGVCPPVALARIHQTVGRGEGEQPRTGQQGDNQ
jgi:solute:Na+ symporter, SSS family